MVSCDRGQMLPDRPVPVDFLDDVIANAEVVKTLAVAQVLVPLRVVLPRSGGR